MGAQRVNSGKWSCGESPNLVAPAPGVEVAVFTVESETRRGLLAAVLRATFLFLLRVGTDSLQVSSPLGLTTGIPVPEVLGVQPFDGVVLSKIKLFSPGRADPSNVHLAFQPRCLPYIPLFGNIGIELCHFFH